MKPKDYIIALGFVVINILLKSINLGEAPFWYDEMISVKNTLLDFGHIKHESEWDNNPPFYYYCLWVWLHIFQTNEINARLLSVIFVSFSTGIAYVFSIKYFNKIVGLWTCLFLSLSNFLFYYSQEARAYSLVLLLSLISSYVFFKFLETKKFTSILILSLVNFLLIYTHYISGLVLVFQFVYVIGFNRSEIIKRFFLHYFIIAALVFIRFTSGQIRHILGFGAEKEFWLTKAGIQELGIALQELFFNKWLAMIFIVLSLFLVFRIIMRKITLESQQLKYSILIGYGSIFVLFILGTQKPLFLSRYLIFTLPFAIIPAVYVLLQFNIWGKIILTIVALFCIFNLNFSKSFGMDYRQIANQIKVLKTSDDFVLVNTKDNLNLFYYYFNRQMYLQNKQSDLAFLAQKIAGVNTVEQLSSLSYKSSKRLFLIQTYHNMNNRKDYVGDYLDSTEKKIFSSNHVKGIEFSVYLINRNR